MTTNEGAMLSSEELFMLYNKSYNAAAGPEKFRHACNFDNYTKVGLMEVYQAGIAEGRKLQRESDAVVGGHAAESCQHHPDGQMVADAIRNNTGELK